MLAGLTSASSARIATRANPVRNVKAGSTKRRVEKTASLPGS